MKKIVFGSLALAIFIVLVIFLNSSQSEEPKRIGADIARETINENALTTYTNTRYGYTLTIPSSYRALSEYDGTPYPLEKDYNGLSMGEDLDHYLGTNILSNSEVAGNDAKGFFEEFTLPDDRYEQPAIDINGNRFRFFEIPPGEGGRRNDQQALLVYYFFNDQGVFSFNHNKGDKTAESIVRSFELN